MKMIMMMLYFRNAIISYVNHMCSSEYTSLCVSGSRLDARDFLSVSESRVPFDAMCLGDTTHRVPSWKMMMRGRRIISKLFFLAGGFSSGKHFLQTSLHGQLVGIPNDEM